MVDPSVVREWRRAGECLRASALCLEHGLYADAVARAYYSIMHSAKAALAHLAISAKGHKGVKNHFGLHLIRAGLIEQEYAADLSQSYEDRLKADYGVTLEFLFIDAEEARDRAQEFRERMREFLGNIVAPEDTDKSW